MKPELIDEFVEVSLLDFDGKDVPTKIFIDDKGISVKPGIYHLKVKVGDAKAVRINFAQTEVVLKPGQEMTCSQIIALGPGGILRVFAQGGDISESGQGENFDSDPDYRTDFLFVAPW